MVVGRRGTRKGPPRTALVAWEQSQRDGWDDGGDRSLRCRLGTLSREVSVVDDRDAELRQALVRGLTPVTLEIVDYDPAWPSRFVALAETLRRRLGSRVVRIEHI